MFTGKSLAFGTPRTEGAGKLAKRLPLKNVKGGFGLGGGWNEIARFSRVTFPRRADVIRPGNDLLPNAKSAHAGAPRANTPPATSPNHLYPSGAGNLPGRSCTFSRTRRHVHEIASGVFPQTSTCRSYDVILRVQAREHRRGAPDLRAPTTTAAAAKSRTWHPLQWSRVVASRCMMTRLQLCKPMEVRVKPGPMATAL